MYCQKETAAKKKAEEEAAAKKKKADSLAEEEAAAKKKKAEEEEAAKKKKNAEEEAAKKKKAAEQAAATKTFDDFDFFGSAHQVVDEAGPSQHEFFQFGFGDPEQRTPRLHPFGFHPPVAERASSAIAVSAPAA